MARDNCGVAAQQTTSGEKLGWGKLLYGERDEHLLVTEPLLVQVVKHDVWLFS